MSSMTFAGSLGSSSGVPTTLIRSVSSVYSVWSELDLLASGDPTTTSSASAVTSFVDGMLELKGGVCASMMEDCVPDCADFDEKRKECGRKERRCFSWAGASAGFWESVSEEDFESPARAGRLHGAMPRFTNVRSWLRTMNSSLSLTL